MLPLVRLWDNCWIGGYQDAPGGNILKIRTEQMEVLDQSTRVDFHRRLVTFLREELPEETASLLDTELLERITESGRRAAVYGIESDAGIAQFVCLKERARFFEVESGGETTLPRGGDKSVRVVEGSKTAVQYLAASKMGQEPGLCTQ